MKGVLNKKLGITTGNLNEFIPELKAVIKSISAEGRTDKEILHMALKKLGWTPNDIQNLLRKKVQEPHKEVSPSFRLYKSKSATGTLKKGQSYKSVEGGSPGLGKGKS